MPLQLFLTLDEINMILAGLGEMKAKDVIHLIINIHKQVNDQQADEPSKEITE